MAEKDKFGNFFYILKPRYFIENSVDSITIFTTYFAVYYLGHQLRIRRWTGREAHATEKKIVKSGLHNLDQNFPRKNNNTLNLYDNIKMYIKRLIGEGVDWILLIIRMVK